MPFRVAALTGIAAFAADLASKQWVVSHGDVVIYNDRASQLPFRLLMSLAAIVVAIVLGRLAAQRGLGRQWGLWIGTALLVAGTIANGVSALLWQDGIPDFISMGGGWVWNVADLEIAVGMTGGILSLGIVAVLVYARERAAVRRA